MSTAVLTQTKGEATQGRLISFGYVGVLLFVLMYYVRPNDWVLAMRTFPFAKIAAFLAIAGFVLDLPLRGKKAIQPITQSGEIKGLILLFGYMWLTIPTAVWTGGSFDLLTTRYWKVILITVLLSATVDSLRRLKRLLNLSILCLVVMALLAIRSYWAGELTHGRVQGALQGDFGNPNDLAFNIVVVLPFCLVFMLLARNPVSRLFWVGCAGLMSLAVIVTFSRAGFLALAAAGLIGVWELGIKGRRPFVILLSALVAIVLIVWLVPAGYGNRLGTILTPDADVTGSAQQRQALLHRSLEITLERPLFGVGPGNFEVVSGVWRDTHNTYTELSAEAGIPALLLFLYVLRRAFASINRTIRSTSHDKRLQLFAQGMRASLAALVVGFLFHSVSYQFFPYLLIGYVVALSRIAQQMVTVTPASSPTRTG